MGKLFRPDRMLGSIEQFNVLGAVERGVTAVFCDVDNTLTRWNDPDVPTRARAFSARLKAHNIDLYLASNNDENRVRPIAQALGAAYICKAGKPLPFRIRALCKNRLINPRRCVFIGDQLVTDVLAGNLADMQTVLVRPIDPSLEFYGTRFNRRLERILFRMLNLRWED